MDNRRRRLKPQPLKTTTCSANLLASGRKPAYRNCKPLQNAPALGVLPFFVNGLSFVAGDGGQYGNQNQQRKPPRASDVSFVNPRLRIFAGSLRRTSSYHTQSLRLRRLSGGLATHRNIAFAAIIASRFLAPHLIARTPVTLFGRSPKGWLRASACGLRLAGFGKTFSQNHFVRNIVRFQDWPKPDSRSPKPSCLLLILNQI